MTQRKITITQIRKTSRELELFIRCASRKLLEADVLLSKWERQNGKGKAYKSVDDFMAYIHKKIKAPKK